MALGMGRVGIMLVVMQTGLMLMLVIGMVTLAAVMGIPTTCRSCSVSCLKHSHLLNDI